MYLKISSFLFPVLIGFLINETSAFPHAQRTCGKCCQKKTQDTEMCGTEPVESYAHPDVAFLDPFTSHPGSQNSIYSEWIQAYEQWERDFPCASQNNSTAYEEYRKLYNVLKNLQNTEVSEAPEYHNCPHCHSHQEGATKTIKIIIETRHKSDNQCPNPDVPKILETDHLYFSENDRDEEHEKLIIMNDDEEIENILVEETKHRDVEEGAEAKTGEKVEVVENEEETEAGNMDKSAKYNLDSEEDVKAMIKNLKGLGVHFLEMGLPNSKNETESNISK